MKNFLRNATDESGAPAVENNDTPNPPVEDAGVVHGQVTVTDMGIKDNAENPGEQNGSNTDEISGGASLEEGKAVVSED